MTIRSTREAPGVVSHNVTVHRRWRNYTDMFGYEDIIARDDDRDPPITVSIDVDFDNDDVAVAFEAAVRALLRAEA